MADVAVDGSDSEDSPSGASLRGSHRLAAVEACPRLWAFRYHWQIRPLGEKPFRLGGSLIHTCYQYHFASMMDERPSWYTAPTLEARLWQQASTVGEPKRSELVAMAKTNYNAFWRWYPKDHETWKPIAIEQEFLATLAEIDPITDQHIQAAVDEGKPAVAERLRFLKRYDGEIVSCRPDLVYETRDDFRWVWCVDYKSHGRSMVDPRTGRLKRWYEGGEFALNWQSLLNLKVLRARLGPRVRGFVIQRTTRQEPYDFDRHPLTIGGDAYNNAGRAAREYVHSERQLEAYIEGGGEPTPRTSACLGRYGFCDYHHVCQAKNKTELYTRLNSGEFTQASAEEILRARARLRVL